jgi:predicted metalloprotease
MRINNEGNVAPETLEKFETVVLHLDKFWKKKLKEEKNLTYYPPKVTLFSRDVITPCGLGLTKFGPFFCARGIYLDVNWFKRLRSEYGAEDGQFSEFYIIAHEFGHHIQSQLGIFSRVLGPGGDGGLKVRGELEADAYGGHWARFATEDPEFPWEITEDDINNALSAAHAVGDDTIHLRRQGVISPEKFGHGTSHQRQAAFMYGYNANKINDMKRFWSWELDRLLGQPDHEPEEQEDSDPLQDIADLMNQYLDNKSNEL